MQPQTGGGFEAKKGRFPPSDNSPAHPKKIRLIPFIEKESGGAFVLEFLYGQSGLDCITAADAN
jgi:hypothetical protein